MGLSLSQMQEFNITAANRTDYNELITVWESSVRATHHFLTETDIQAYKKLIFNDFFDKLQLYCIKQNNKIISFMGIDQDFLQMLFIHPAFRGKGIGKLLVEYAIDHHAVTKVDVNEQNTQALGFYYRMGFELDERFDFDAVGKAYPVLAMSLKD